MPSPSPSRGLIFFAVPQEAGPFRRRWASLAASRSKEAANDDRVRIAVSGMGAGNAEREFARALNHAGGPPDWIVTGGFAGGLNPELRAGDVVFEADAGSWLREPLQRAGARSATFHCADRVATTAAEKSSLRRQTGADAVEMESGILRQLARKRGIPSATVRVISDAADADLPLDFNALMTPDMKLSGVGLAWRLLRAPGKIPELIRFGRQTARAADRLAEVLVAALR